MERAPSQTMAYLIGVQWAECGDASLDPTRKNVTYRSSKRSLRGIQSIPTDGTGELEPE